MNPSECLTVVITYFNLRYFELTLESLAVQTDKNFKVFIGNDKSFDNPEILINKYRHELSIEYVAFSENLGGFDLTLQWKRCLDYVTTPYFLILGDDDLLSKNTVYEFNQKIKNKKDKYTQSVYRLGIQRIDDRGYPISNKIVYVDMESSTDFIVKRAKNEVISSLGEYIFLTEKYREVGLRKYPKAFYSDNMMVLEISNFGPIQNIERAYCLVRVSQYSFTGSSLNEIELHRAASLFYFDLINTHSKKFDKKDVKYFLPSILYGKKHKILSLTWFNLISMIIRYNGFRILVNLLKEKIKKINNS